MSQDDVPAAIPWYKSNILRALLVVALTHTLTHYKLISQFAPDDIGTFVDEILSAIGYAATGFAAYSRVAHDTPPIVSTKAKAEAAAVPSQPQDKTP